MRYTGLCRFPHLPILIHSILDNLLLKCPEAPHSKTNPPWNLSPCPLSISLIYIARNFLQSRQSAIHLLHLWDSESRAIVVKMGTWCSWASSLIWLLFTWSAYVDLGVHSCLLRVVVDDYGCFVNHQPFHCVSLPFYVGLHIAIYVSRKSKDVLVNILQFHLGKQNLVTYTRVSS
ncbi:hypothetical protein Tco_0341034 [Tanacetum coccineum]